MTKAWRHIIKGIIRMATYQADPYSNIITSTSNAENTGFIRLNVHGKPLGWLHFNSTSVPKENSPMSLVSIAKKSPGATPVCLSALRQAKQFIEGFAQHDRLIFILCCVSRGHSRCVPLQSPMAGCIPRFVSLQRRHWHRSTCMLLAPCQVKII